MEHKSEMSQWEILGIEPSADERVIKRAYAQRLKVARPDEDPKQFQALRTAYEYALDTARHTQFGISTETTAQQIEVHTANETPVSFYAMDRQPYRVRMEDATFSAQRPDVIAQTVWHGFKEQCGRLAESVPQDILFDQVLDTAKTELTSVLKQPNLDSLEAREIFKHMAFAYCAQEAASPVIRIACLEVLKWEEERKLINFDSDPQTRRAIDRAIADKQFSFLQEKAQHSTAVKALLKPGMVKIAWRKFYGVEFASDMRNCISHIRTSMPEVEHYRLGQENVAMWLDAAARPWPTLIAFICALFVGVGLAVVSAGLMREAVMLEKLPSSVRDISAFLICTVLFMLPMTLVAAYPRYVHRPLQVLASRIKAKRRVHLGWWWACVLVSSIALFMKVLPSAFEDIFVWAVAILVIGDILLKSNMNSGHLIFLVMMVVIMSVPFGTAFTPFVGPAAFFIPALASALFISFRGVMISMYGQDWYTIRMRALLLGTGIVLVGGEYWLASRFPLLSALIGWWWILAAAGAADIFLLTIARNKGQAGALVWLISIGALFYLPQAVEINSPISGMIHLQMTFAASLLIAMTQNAWADLKTGKKS